MAAPESSRGSAKEHAQAVLRVRGAVFACALLPAAVAVVLWAGDASGHLGGGWAGTRWVVTAVAVVVLCVAAVLTSLVARARVPIPPAVPLPERSAPDLYRMVRGLADQLDVPAPSAIALTPDCDSWLEDEGRRTPTLVIGSPFLWWMRVAELRALLAPVVAGTGPAVHPDIAAARGFVRALDAATTQRGLGWLARSLLRPTGPHAAAMEHLVATAASVRAQGVDQGVRVLAQEQVGLAYAGWDRLLTRVAVPAWRMGRWPTRLDVGVTHALTDLARRDRLAEGFTSRLGERPACDLLESPGEMDQQVSLLAARLFYGVPASESARESAGWQPLEWSDYSEEVVDLAWRTEATRLFAALDATQASSQAPDEAPSPHSAAQEVGRPTLTRVLKLLGDEERRAALAARISAQVVREERRSPTAEAPFTGGGELIPGVPGEVTPIGLPPEPVKSGREILADHVTAAVCCAAVDSGDASAGLDWLDGPVLLMPGSSSATLLDAVRTLIDSGSPRPLTDWLAAAHIRPDKTVRLL